MVAVTNLHLGKGMVRGDQFSIPRKVTGLSYGVTVTAALLTIKAALTNPDPGVIQKSITSSNVPGTGQVEDTGASGIASLRFDLITTDTLAVTADLDYVFDIQVTLSTNDIFTLETGITSFRQQVGTS